MRMIRVRRHPRLLCVPVSFFLDFLMNTEIKHEDCGDPEKEDQILHGAPPDLFYGR
jgi:hypothetical protein